MDGATVAFDPWIGIGQCHPGGCSGGAGVAPAPHF